MKYMHCKYRNNNDLTISELENIEFRLLLELKEIKSKVLEKSVRKKLW